VLLHFIYLGELTWCITLHGVGTLVKPAQPAVAERVAAPAAAALLLQMRGTSGWCATTHTLASSRYTRCGAYTAAYIYGPQASGIL
jgi:hypothetical protein